MFSDLYPKSRDRALSIDIKLFILLQALAWKKLVFSSTTENIKLDERLKNLDKPYITEIRETNKIKQDLSLNAVFINKTFTHLKQMKRYHWSELN